MNTVDVFKELCYSWRKGKEDYELYRICFTKLFFFAKGFFQKFPDADLIAEDIAQVTLTKFFEKSLNKSFTNIYFAFKSPQSWVYQVTKNACLTELNKRNRRGGIEADVERHKSKTMLNNGELKLEYKDQLKGIEKCLNNERDFKILQLSRDGYKAKEISTMISESTGSPIKSKTVSNRMTIIKIKLNNCSKNGNL